MSDRNLALTTPHMTGDDVSGCQRDLNARFAAWKVPLVLDVDGDWGMRSRDAAASVLYGLGVDKGGDFDGVSPTDRIKIRHGYSRLNAVEAKRYASRAGWRKRLAVLHEGGGVRVALEFATLQIGVTEHPAGSNRGRVVDAWERACGVLGAPWCGCFINACLVAAGFSNQVWLRYCPAIEAKARAGEGGWGWHSKPAVGDLVLYGSSVAQHVGIVERVDGPSSTRFLSIEGNTSNGPGGSQSNGGVVARRDRTRDGSLSGFPVRGFARPNWS